MTQYRGILRLHALGISNVNIAANCQCSRNTVTSVLKRAREIGLSYSESEGLTDKGLGEKLFPQSGSRPAYRMPDYAEVNREMQKRPLSSAPSSIPPAGTPRSSTLADAICNRIVHDSYTIMIDGSDSMRKRKGIADKE